MTVLWIILGIIAFLILALVVLLHFSVRAYIQADKKTLSLTVKYLFFTVYKLKIPDKNDTKPESEENTTADEKTNEQGFELSEIPITDSTDETEKTEPSEQNTENDSEKAEESKEQIGKKDESVKDNEKKNSEPKPTLIEMWNEYKKYIPAGKKAFGKLLKMIRFYDLNVYLKIGNEDPYKAGLNFGRINAVFYNILALLCCLFTVKIEHTEIDCDFEKKETDFSLKTAVYVRPSAIVALAVYLGIYYLKIRKSAKKLSDNAKNKAKETVTNE